jgi:hypothetical protein
MAGSKGIDGRLAEAIRRLEELGAGLEALSVEIWEAIDHEDPEQLEAGVRFKQQYNERRKELAASAEQMLSLLKAHPGAGPGSGTEAEKTTGETGNPIPALRTKPSAIDASAAPAVGNLEQKAPFGFMLFGQTFTSASAWPLFYEALLQELYGRDAAKLSRLADEPGELTYRGKPLFARVPDRLGDPLPITDAIFAEADLDPEVLIQVIRGLIEEMGYPLDSFKILLKEKNRGTVETLCLAA